MTGARPRPAARAAVELALGLLLLLLLLRPGSLIELVLSVGAVAIEVMVLATIYQRSQRRWTPDRSLVITGISAAAAGALLALAVSFLMARLIPEVALSDPPLAVALGGAIIGEFLLGLYVLVVRHPQALEEARALRLESELATLRARLEPHFLLNSLNAIAGLIGAEPARARRALAALGDLLAEALEHAPERRHRLDEEIAWLRAYTVIFEARYGEGLVVEWKIAPEFGAVPVPRLLLQPLVENAMIHGIAASGAGTIIIAARRVDAALVIEISNSGPAVREEDLVSGHGLTLVRRRLVLELPGASLRIAPGVEGGTIATLALPLAAPPTEAARGLPRPRGPS